MSFLESIFYMAWRGLAIGLIISAPMGPVGMLCIQRTLDKGRRAGLYTGIGAAISDFFYCLLTGFGLSFIEEFLEKNSNVIQLAGSAVLIAFGIYLFRKNPSKSLKKPAEESVSVKKNILGGFFFTFSNPLILFLTIGLFARFNFLLPEFKIHQYLTGFVFIFIGAFIWWWLITFTVDKVRSHFNIRSMWLINKIIGVIILLFAVVGIITATSALAGARNSRCWNSTRGFDSFCADWERYAPSSHSGLINNCSADSIFLITPLQSSDAEFRFKSHLDNPSSKSPWGIVLRSKGTTSLKHSDLIFSFSPGESLSDGVSSSAQLSVVTTLDGQLLHQEGFSDNANLFSKIKGTAKGPDPSGATNFFKIKIDNRRLSLYGGLHSPLLLSEMQLPPGFTPDSIGFFLSPSAEIEFSEIRLSSFGDTDCATGWEQPDVLKEYIGASRDLLEGYWKILDRSLEESLLKPGGDYTLASVKTENGYDLIYVDGARINADGWTHGMRKGHLAPTGIGGVWNVEWIDAMHRPLSYEVKAQRDTDGIITIQFPYHNSQLRLIRFIP